MKNSQPEKLYIFVDESGIDVNSPLAYLAMAVTDSPDKTRVACESVIEKITHDPELSQNIPSVRKNGINFFHYAADHIEIRTEFIKLLPTLNFDGYLIFVRKDELVGEHTKVQLLKLLLENLLRPRLLEKYYADIEIVYERFDEGKTSIEKEFAEEIETLCVQLFAEFEKDIKNVSISFNNKSELCLGIPDYLCGIISDYFSLKLSGKEVADSLQERNYFRIEGKVRMIQDLTRKKFYSRKDPIDIESI